MSSHLCPCPCTVSETWEMDKRVSSRTGWHSLLLSRLTLGQNVKSCEGPDPLTVWKESLDARRADSYASDE